jgi:hypothetical protein
VLDALQRHALAAACFSRGILERLKGEEYTLNQAFRAKVDTKAGTMLSSATPVQIMDRRAKSARRRGAAWHPKGERPRTQDTQ